MAEFVGGEPISVGVDEPITFENKTHTAFDVGCGIVFRKSGLYRVCIVGKHVSVSVEPERKKGKWIPVSESLPDDEEKEYLVTILDRDDDVCEVYKGFYQDGKWWTQWCHGCLELEKEPCGDNIVTAWMPLPEPYREEGETE